LDFKKGLANLTDEEKLQLSTEEKLKMVADYIDNMTDEEFEKECGHIFVDKGSKDSPWHPFKQNSFYLCWYYGKNGNVHLCTDGMGRGFCPECREKAEKEFLDWDNLKEREQM
jgi:hypothetical protein